MSSLTIDSSASSSTSPSTASVPQQRNGRPVKRMLNVARLHVVNRATVFWWPLFILSLVWILNYAIWWSIALATETAVLPASAQNGMQWSGSTMFAFVYMMVIALQGMTMTFPFALGLSVSRRQFFAGSSLAFIVLALGYGLLLAALSVIEEATNGWGIGGRMFSVVYFGDGNFGERFFVIFLGLLFFFSVGTALGTIFMRWRTNGLLLSLAGALIAIVGAAAAITLTRNWGLVGEAFVAAGPVGVAAWLIVPIILCGAVGYVALRRATPKN